MTTELSYPPSQAAFGHAASFQGSLMTPWLQVTGQPARFDSTAGRADRWRRS